MTPPSHRRQAPGWPPSPHPKDPCPAPVLSPGPTPCIAELGDLGSQLPFPL